MGLLRVRLQFRIQLVIDYWTTGCRIRTQGGACAADASIGVILPPPLCESQAAVSELVKAGIPVVAIASGRLSEALSCVRIDDFSAGREMDRSPARQGHTRIGFIRGRDDLSASALRYDGFVTALREAGWRGARLVQHGDYTYRSGLAAAEKLLSSAGHRPRFSPATTTWVPPPSPWRIGAGWKCHATCRWWFR